MEIILLIFLIIILILFSYYVFNMFKWIFNTKIRRIWILNLLGIFILTAIINKVFFTKTEFFPLESETSYNNQATHKHVVIANPPKNLDSLATLIKSYSESNLNLCKITKKGNYLRVFFYKETWDTPRDFKSTDDDCNFGSAYIGCHTDDIICILETDNKQSIKWKFSVRKNVDSEWIQYSFKVECTKYKTKLK